MVRGSKAGIQIVVFCILGLLLGVAQHFYSGPTVSEIRSDLSEQISQVKLNQPGNNGAGATLVFQEDGILQSWSSMSHPLVRKKPTQDTALFWGGNWYALVQGAGSWHLFNVNRYLEQVYWFEGKGVPLFSKSTQNDAVFQGLQLAELPLGTKGLVGAIAFVWFIFVCLGIWILFKVARKKWVTRWLFPIGAYFLFFHALFPEQLDVFHGFTKSLSFGPLPIQNAWECLFWAISFLLLIQSSLNGMEKAVLRMLGVVFLIAISQSAIENSTSPWDFLQLSQFEMYQWIYLIDLGLFGAGLIRLGMLPQADRKLELLAFFLLALYLYFGVSPDWGIIAPVGFIYLISGVNWNKWFKPVISTAFVVLLGVFLLHKFILKKELIVAKHEVGKAFFSNDFALEENMAFSLEEFQKDANLYRRIQDGEIFLTDFFQRSLDPALGNQYAVEAQAYSMDGEFATLERVQIPPFTWEPTGIMGLKKAKRPYKSPVYLAEFPVGPSLVSLVWIQVLFKPNPSGALDSEMSWFSLVRPQFYHFEDSCWYAAEHDLGCKPLGEWTDNGGLTQIVTLPSGEQLAVTIDSPSNLSLFTLSTVFLLFSLSGLLLFVVAENRKILWNITLSRFSLYQMGVFAMGLVVVLGVVQYGLIEFKASHKEQLQREKARSVILELNSKFKSGVIEDEVLEKALKKFSYVFQTPIELFRANGEQWLASTSNMEEGWATHGIPQTLRAQISLHEDQSQTLFTHDGALLFPWIIKGKHLGYGSIPLEGKSNALEYGLGKIQSLVLTGVLALLLGLFIWMAYMSWKRIKPIIQIRNQITSWDLEDGPIQLSYDKHDEIGDLVRALNRAMAALASREKEMAWKGVAQQVAHELKNPLTPMRLNIQLLDRRLKNLSEANQVVISDFITNTLQQIDSLSRIAGSFSNLAQMPQLRFSEHNILDSMNTAVEVFQSEAEFSLDLDQAQGWSVYWDKDQWIRIWTNIFKNSVQACTGKPAQIRISIQESPKGVLSVIISDNGKGMHPNQLKMAFEPHFTTKTEGTGIGLYMVKQIVKAHGGGVSLGNNNGRGLYVKMVIPLRYSA